MHHDYAPLFDAMHGARWLLSARPATLAQGHGNTSVNVLTAAAAANQSKVRTIRSLALSAAAG